MALGGDPSDPSQFRQDEYDANLQWAPTKGCLKGLSVRARYAVVHQHGGNVNDLTDLRGIVNYTIKSLTRMLISRTGGGPGLRLAGEAILK